MSEMARIVQKKGRKPKLTKKKKARKISRAKKRANPKAPTYDEQGY